MDNNLREKLKRQDPTQIKKFSRDVRASLTLTDFGQLQEIHSDRRNSLAYISPLPPERSGISDYSAELLRELNRHYKIDVIVDQDTISDSWVVANCAIRNVPWFDKHAYRYDRILYHFGNSPFHKHMFKLLEKHPGIVVLHEFFLSGVLSYMEGNHTPGAWATALYASHGYSAVLERAQHGDKIKWKYPCNLDVIKRANGIIVHSQFSKTLADTWYGEGSSAAWAQIPLLRTPADKKDRAAARTTLGFTEDDFLVCTFGFLQPTKMNHHLLEAWLASPLRLDPHCYLVFVGEIIEENYGTELLKYINDFGVSDRIKITGFASPALYQTYLSAADIAVQLRTLSRGETSGSILDCMNYGLATVINAHGSASEIPSDAVFCLADQFTQENLSAALLKLWREPDFRSAMGERARLQICSEHHPRIIGDRYRSAIERMSPN